MNITIAELTRTMPIKIIFMK